MAAKKVDAFLLNDKVEQVVKDCGITKEDYKVAAGACTKVLKQHGKSGAGSPALSEDKLVEQAATAIRGSLLSISEEKALKLAQWRVKMYFRDLKRPEKWQGTLAAPEAKRRKQESPAHADVKEALQALRSSKSAVVQAVLSSVEGSEFESLRCFSTTQDTTPYGSPQVLPLSSCWKNKPDPSTTAICETVFKACFSAKGLAKAIDGHGETHDAATFMARMHAQTHHLEDDSAEEQNSMFILNINLMDPAFHQNFIVPDHILGIERAELTDHMPAASMALKDTCVPPHDDHGTSGISFTVGKCAKVWFFWPPTEANQENLKRVRLSVVEDKNDWSGFEGGLAALLTSQDAVYLPPGWIHATIAIQPGVLVGRTFYEPSCSTVAAQCILDDVEVDQAFAQMYDGHTFDSLAAIETYYSDTLETGLFVGSQEALEETIKGWFKVEEALRRARDDGTIDIKRLTTICREIRKRLKQRSAFEKSLPRKSEECPHHTEATLDLEHFLSQHIMFLEAEGKRKQRGKKKA